jgi:hypothetical protein
MPCHLPARRRCARRGFRGVERLQGGASKPVNLPYHQAVTILQPLRLRNINPAPDRIVTEWTVLAFRNDRPDPAGQGLHRERFGQHMHARFQVAIAHGRILRIAGDEEHL